MPFWAKTHKFLGRINNRLYGNRSVYYDSFYTLFSNPQLSIYATFQTVEARVEGLYMGTAVNGNSEMSIRDRPLNGGIHHGIITAGYVVPVIITSFAILVLVLAYIFLVAIECHRDNCQSLRGFRAKAMDLKKKAEDDVTLQANLLAIVWLCFLFTIYIFVLDMLSVSIENMDTLPRYFRKKKHLYLTTLVCSILSLLLDIVGMGLLSVSYLCCDDRNKYFMSITVGMICCIGSTVMSLSFHFQDILIAWSTAPFYASKIALFYGIVIFVHFMSSKYAYIMSSELAELCCKKKTLKCAKIVIIIITSIFVIGTIATVATFIVHFPTNNFIEESVTALTTIYNGAIILFGGLLAYKLGLFYFSSSFSINGALRKAINQMNNPPPNPIPWNELTDEGKLAKVMKAIIDKEAKIPVSEGGGNGEESGNQGCFRAFSHCCKRDDGRGGNGEISEEEGVDGGKGNGEGVSEGGGNGEGVGEVGDGIGDKQGDKDDRQ